MDHTTEIGYSAPVSMELHVENEIIGVDKVGPDRIVLSESRSVRDGEAKLVIRIGDAIRRKRIILNNSNPADGTVLYW
ncbi:MAG: hypothetical protein J0M17_22310 [Planctomycetes bacterium]|nr:hypothetical protein [Planctomycetota bacterium]